jgi:hypothetical protein
MDGSELQIEGFGHDIAGSTSVVYCDNASLLWIPYEFIGSGSSGSGTRVLLHGEHSSGSRGLIAAEKWTMIFDMTGSVGTRNWSILASMMRHMLAPITLVVTPDVVVPAAFVGHCRGATLIVFRWLTDLTNPSGLTVGSLFFPLNMTAAQITTAQRAFWKGMPLRTSDNNLGLVLNETRPQGLHLVSSVLESGVVSLAWYRMSDSDELVSDVRRDSLASWLGAISDRIIGVIKG